MKVKTYDNTELHNVLVGMITDPVVCSRIADKWTREGLFDGRWANMVGNWCVSHFKKYGKPINGQIESTAADYFQKHKMEERVVRMVESLLFSLSERHKRQPKSSEYILDLAEKYFNRVRMQKGMAEAEKELDGNEVNEAWGKLKNIEPISFKGDGTISASDIETRKVYWLWHPWIPKGELSIIDGDMGTGKTQIALDIAARVTLGKEMPHGSRKRKPANVLYLSSEDDASTTIVPRFEAAGGDRKKLYVWDINTPPLQFPKDADQLNNLVKKHKARLVVIDPFYGFLEGRIDTNTDPKMRQALKPLSDIAQQTRTSIILTRHFNKNEDQKALYRGGGSVAITAHCPSAIVLGKNPENGVRVMAGARIKHAKMPDSLTYEIELCKHPKVGDLSRIEWGGSINLCADDILRMPKKQGRPSKMDEYIEYLQDRLAGGKRIPSDKLEKEFIDEFGVSFPTYKRARKEAGVESKKKGFQGDWYSFIRQY